jgi:hypothetical protein
VSPIAFAHQGGIPQRRRPRIQRRHIHILAGLLADYRPMPSPRGFIIATALTILFAAACARTSDEARSSSSEQVRAAGRQDVERRLLCNRRRDASEQADGQARQRDQIALVGRLEGADPAADAQAAVARGDFRLIRGIAMTGTYPLGVDCRTSHVNRGAPPLTLATRFYSDVVNSCETPGGPDRCRTELLLDAYGPAFNRALVSHPAYPYADLCRVPSGAPAPSSSRRIADVAEYGFPGLAPTERPHDLHEAARRGTPAAVARMIAAAGRAAIDRPDRYGMTPLAWAVARRRPDVAARFLAAGASPIGEDCDDPAREQSPLRLALLTGQEALARRMLTPAVTARVTPWPAGLFEAAARGGSASLLARMLREPHQGPAASHLGGRGHPLPAASEAVLEAFDRTLCWRRPVSRAVSVRMIGVYESRAVAGRLGGYHVQGPVSVRVAASRRPVLLVLVGYEPVEWRIELAPGARLAGVVAMGMHRPIVTGDVRGAPVLVNDQRDNCPALGGGQVYAYEAGEAQQRIADAVERMIGVPVADFQGSYSAASFEIR